MLGLIFDSIVFFVSNNILYSALALLAGLLPGYVLAQSGRVWNKKWRKTPAYLKCLFICCVVSCLVALVLPALLDFQRISQEDVYLENHLATRSRSFYGTNKDKEVQHRNCENYIKDELRKPSIKYEKESFLRLKYYARNAAANSSLPNYDELDENTIRQRYGSYCINELPPPKEIKDLDKIYQLAYEYRLRCSMIYYKPYVQLLSVTNILIVCGMLVAMLFGHITFHALGDIKFNRNSY